MNPSDLDRLHRQVHRFQAQQRWTLGLLGAGVLLGFGAVKVAPERREALLTALEQAGVGRRRFVPDRRGPKVGGGYETLALQAAGGPGGNGVDGLALSTNELSEDDARRLAPVFAAVLACVPAAEAAPR